MNHEFFKKLKFNSTFIGIDPDNNMQWKYNITMIYNEIVWSFEYFIGCGNGTGYDYYPTGKRNRHMIQSRSFARIIYYVPPNKLDFKEVVTCIAHDARIGQDYDYTGGMWDMIEDFGMESNRKSENVYRACVNSFIKAKDMFRNEYNSFLNLSQDPSEWS